MTKHEMLQRALDIARPQVNDEVLAKRAMLGAVNAGVVAGLLRDGLPSEAMAQELAGLVVQAAGIQAVLSPGEGGPP